MPNTTPEQTPAEWLKTLPAWDKVPRVENWLHTYLGVDFFRSRLFSFPFFIGLIGRALNPGFRFPYCLVIEGQQGCGKSAALQILGGDWYGNSDFDLKNRDSFSAFKDKWIYEFAELGRITKAEKHLQKSFLERTADEYRPVYSRNVVKLARQTVFVGTTNYVEFMDNPIDGRRFWPVRCETILLEALAADREQLFAEALHAWHKNEASPDVNATCSFASPQQQARRQARAWLKNLPKADKPSVDWQQIAVAGDPSPACPHPSVLQALKQLAQALRLAIRVIPKSIRLLRARP